MKSGMAPLFQDEAIDLGVAERVVFAPDIEAVNDQKNWGMCQKRPLLLTSASRLLLAPIAVMQGPNCTQFF